GVSAGLSLLAHPLGIVPATQVGLAVLLADRSLGHGWRRVRAASVYGVIALHPDLFRIQFGGNVLGRAAPGVGRTLLSPGAVLRFQLGQFWELAMPPQAV